jgi:uncharacterized membrane protein YbhN (UPF0104 family)
VEVRRTQALTSHVGLGHVIVGVLGLAFIVAVIAAPQLLGTNVVHAFARLAHARPVWLWLAGLALLGSFLASGAAWRTTLAACGTRVSFRDSCARYGIGSLVNTVAPFQLGDVARVGLFSRVVAERSGPWTVAGGLAAIAVVRATCLTVLGVAAWALGGLPAWPLAVLGGIAVVVLAIAISSRNRAPQRQFGHLLDAFRALASSPAKALRLVGWVAAALIARVGAGTAIAMALGIRSPLIAALLVVTALDVAGQFPLTPGNIGVANGAVALALQSRGIALATALAVGLAFQAVQTAVDVGAGVAGALHLAPAASRIAGRRVNQLLAAVAVLGLSLGFGLTVIFNVA